MTVLVPPDAAELVVRLLRDVLPSLDERLVVGLRISTELGHGPGPPSLPWVLVREDGSTWSWPAPLRSTIRISAWHETQHSAKRVCSLALAALVAQRDAGGVIAAEPIAGAEVGPDPYTGGPVATASAAVFTRPRPEL
ncbi:hypothetical protein [Saccharopolyspora hattusasensis]|uniref:hypothetical protein n=1 Tax=Saccharopolyspora hattusasensis TaxID=1128679 RepID=UPI003D985853